MPPARWSSCASCWSRSPVSRLPSPPSRKLCSPARKGGSTRRKRWLCSKIARPYGLGDPQPGEALLLLGRGEAARKELEASFSWAARRGRVCRSARIGGRAPARNWTDWSDWSDGSDWTRAPGAGRLPGEHPPGSGPIGRPIGPIGPIRGRPEQDGSPASTAQKRSDRSQSVQSVQSVQSAGARKTQNGCQRAAAPIVIPAKAGIQSPVRSGPVTPPGNELPVYSTFSRCATPGSDLRREATEGGIARQFSAPCKDGDSQWVPTPTRELVAPPGSNRSSGGGNRIRWSTSMQKGHMVVQQACRPERE